MVINISVLFMKVKASAAAELRARSPSPRINIQISCERRLHGEIILIFAPEHSIVLVKYKSSR